MARAIRLPIHGGRDLKISISRPSRHDDVMPVCELADLLPDGSTLTAAQLGVVDGNVSTYEGLVLGALVASRRPTAIFELGTFDGRTSLIFAANAPGTRIFTLDLPAAELDQAALTIGLGDLKYVNKKVIGARIVAAEDVEQVTMLSGDSATFDYGPYNGTIDFVFVDACHEYEYVLSDSRAAMALLGSGGGMIAWHDYSIWTGVTRALNELLELPAFARMRRLRDTSLVVLEVPPH
jgi:predicted O-methyltransferase YrrM